MRVIPLFVEAVVFLSAIIGVLLALSAFVFHMITRDKTTGGYADIEEAVDAVTDSALEEINKTSKLVLDELDEKYKALLFVYQLVDDKKKALETDSPEEVEEAEETEGSGEIKEVSELDISIGDDLTMESLMEAAGIEPEISYLEPGPGDEFPAETVEAEPQGFITHPKYASIRELLDSGLSVAEAARRLDMGQGEVQLIMGISGRAG